jgi:hypothetical protein
VSDQYDSDRARRYRTIPDPVVLVAQKSVESYVGMTGRIGQHIAQQAVRHYELARLTGAMAEEIGFDFEVNIKTYLR